MARDHKMTAAVPALKRGLLLLRAAQLLETTPGASKGDIKAAKQAAADAAGEAASLLGYKAAVKKPRAKADK